MSCSSLKRSRRQVVRREDEEDEEERGEGRKGKREDAVEKEE